MKKLFQTLLILLLTTTSIYAQQGHTFARIHAAKMAYIEDRLHLSGDSYKNFVPIYSQYEKETNDTRRAFFEKYKTTTTAQPDDATARQLIDDNLDYQQAVIEIKRKYNDRFLKVLTAQQLADMYMAEREFRQMLMQKLKNRRGRMGR